MDYLKTCAERGFLIEQAFHLPSSVSAGQLSEALSEVVGDWCGNADEELQRRFPSVFPEEMPDSAFSPTLELLDLVESGEMHGFLLLVMRISTDEVWLVYGETYEEAFLRALAVV